MSTPPPSGTRPRGGRLRVVGLVVVVLAVVLVGTGVVGLVTSVVPGFSESLSAEPMTPPVDVRQELGAGPWVVFERAGVGTVAAEQVTVEDATGAAVPVEPMTSDQTLTIGGTTYTGAARFVVPADGTYRIVVAAAAGQGASRVLVARDVGSLAGTAIGAVAALVIGVLALVTGIVLTVLGRRRPASATTGPAAPQDHAAYRAPTATTGSTAPPAPPAGWYPDPAGSGRLRWWDGAAWHPSAPPDGRR